MGENPSGGGGGEGPQQEATRCRAARGETAGGWGMEPGKGGGSVPAPWMSSRAQEFGESVLNPVRAAIREIAKLGDKARFRKVDRGQFELAPRSSINLPPSHARARYARACLRAQRPPFRLGLSTGSGVQRRGRPGRSAILPTGWYSEERRVRASCATAVPGPRRRSGSYRVPSDD